ncbi:MAG: flagellar brake protein [Alteromonadaceae bacterium]|nr:flagellar brake protein [Alteromonadaceae bacterium]
MALFSEKKGLSSADINKLRSLRPGTPIDLQITMPTTVRRVRSEYIGIDGMKMIIVRYPDETKYGRLGDGLYADRPVVMRVILDETGEILAFKTTLKAIVRSPVHLLFLSFPDSIQSQGLRGEKRAQIRAPAQIVSDIAKKRLAIGMVLDISNSGCRVAAEKKENRKIEQNSVVLHLNDPSGKLFELKGSIMNIKSDELNFYYGIRFEEDNEEKRRLLDRLMVSL